MADQEESKKGEKEQNSSFQDKAKETLKEFKNSEGVESLIDFAKNNTRDTIALVILLTGIIMLFINPLWGGSLIGIVGGIYFADQILLWIADYRKMVEAGLLVKPLLFGGILLGILIEAPMIVIGAAAAIAIRYLLVGR